MKNKIFIVAIFGALIWYLQCKQEAYGMPYHEYPPHVLDSLRLDGIQGKIYDTFVQAVVARKEDGLVHLKSDLKALEAKHANPLIKYWQGYLQYYHAIFNIQNGNKEASEKEINAGIDIVNAIKNKNSEDLALLAMLQSFSMQFKSGMEAGAYSSKVKNNVKKAIELDEQNLRAYFVAGSNDFYTPEKYGGGEKVESYLLKAISLPEQRIKSMYLPSWGKDSAYEMLIKFYMKKEKWADAKKQFQDAIRLYPNNYPISQLAVQLVNK